MVENRPINPNEPPQNDAILSSYNLSRRFPPHKQFAFTLIASLMAIVCSYGIKGSGDGVWFWAFMGLVFYVWLTTLMAFFKRTGVILYTIYSWLFFLLLAAISIGIATLLSRININNLPEYRTLFTANLIFYIVSTLIVAIMRETAKLTGVEY